MNTFARKTILTTALMGAGLTALAPGAAFATESNDHTDTTSQEGLANIGDVQTITPVNACNNDIPVNALGVQVPIQDTTANVPVLSGAGQDLPIVSDILGDDEDSDGGSAHNGSGVSKGCENPVASAN